MPACFEGRSDAWARTQEHIGNAQKGSSEAEEDNLKEVEFRAPRILDAEQQLMWLRIRTCRGKTLLTPLTGGMRSSGKMQTIPLYSRSVIQRHRRREDSPGRPGAAVQGESTRSFRAGVTRISASREGGRGTGLELSAIAREFTGKVQTLGEASKTLILYHLQESWSMEGNLRPSSARPWRDGLGGTEHYSWLGFRTETRRRRNSR